MEDEKTECQTVCDRKSKSLRLTSTSISSPSISTRPSLICACIRSTSKLPALTNFPRDLFSTYDKNRRCIFAGSDIDGNEGNGSDQGKLRNVGKVNIMFNVVIS